MEVTQAIAHAREVRQRLRFPANAKPDFGINLKRTTAPSVVPVAPTIQPAMSDDSAFGPVVVAAPVSLDDSVFGPIVHVEPSNARPKIKEIAQIVAEHFGIGRTAMISARRDMKYCAPRQITMYLCHILTLRSYPEIGRNLGHRDHSTIISGVRKIQAQIAGRDEKLIADVDALYKKITARWPECAVTSKF